MSRINDALKQAQQSQVSQPPAGLPPLTPAARKTSGRVGWVVPGLVGLLLLGAGIFIGMALFQKPAAMPVAAAPVSGSAPVVAATKPVAAAKVAITTTVAKVIPATNQPAKPVAAMAPAPLKLQGIMANPDRPSAIVNGQTVLVGDRVGDFRVKAIRSNAITLQKPDGSLKTLNLAE